MERLKPVHLLAGFGWLNVFALLWVWLFDLFSGDSFAIGATLVCFLAFAVITSALGTQRRD